MFWMRTAVWQWIAKSSCIRTDNGLLYSACIILRKYWKKKISLSSPNVCSNMCEWFRIATASVKKDGFCMSTTNTQTQSEIRKGFRRLRELICIGYLLSWESMFFRTLNKHQYASSAFVNFIHACVYVISSIQWRGERITLFKVNMSFLCGEFNVSIEYIILSIFYI